MDILNTELMANKNDVRVILRRPSSLVFWWADQRIPPELLPSVTPVDFYKWGNTEMVKTRFRLNSLDATEIAKQAQKLLGPLGEAGVVDGQLTMQDAVGRLRYVGRIIQKIDEKAKI
jgi:hypothetical protein